MIKPVVPVRSLIHAAICRGANSTGLGVRSYSRIKRRGPVCTPRHKAQVPVVCLVVDTSGSMGRGNGSDLQKAVSLVVGISRTIGTLNVVWTDTEPHLQRNVSSPSGIKCKGGGGTDMRDGVAFADALRGRDRADVLVLVTDGYTPWPERQTRAELVTVITTGASGPRWGRVIRTK